MDIYLYQTLNDYLASPLKTFFSIPFGRMKEQQKKKKKYYDKQGNLITDKTLIQDIQQGKTVISYKEEKIDLGNSNR